MYCYRIPAPSPHPPRASSAGHRLHITTRSLPSTLACPTPHTPLHPPTPPLKGVKKGDRPLHTDTNTPLLPNAADSSLPPRYPHHKPPTHTHTRRQELASPLPFVAASASGVLRKRHPHKTSTRRAHFFVTNTRARHPRRGLFDSPTLSRRGQHTQKRTK